MAYLTITLRGEEYEIDYRVVEDDPTTNAFVSEWEFVDKGFDGPPLDLTDAEEELINLKIGEAYSESDADHYIDEC